MRIMNLSMPSLVLGLAFCLSGAASAQTNHFSFDGGIGMINPCDGSIVIVNGPNTINYEQNSTADGAVHVAIHMRFDGTGQDTASNPFAVSFIANGQFDSAVSSYDVPYHSMWIGQGNAPNFSMDGVVRVFVQNGGAVGAGIVQYQTSCKAGLQ